MIMETTRGARGVEGGYSREVEVDRLATSIARVFDRGGSVLIPSFALGRTQEILAMLALLMREGRIPTQPVYIGGLGRVFTEIYDLQSHRANRQHPELLLHDALHLIVLDRRKAGEIKLNGRHLFVLTAGMMTEHTTAHEMAVRMMENERHGIFFVGYADPETPGGRLKETQPGDRFLFSADAGELERRCEVDEFDLTAHAQREDLVELVSRVNPRTLVLGHGNDEARAWFAAQVQERHPSMQVFQPGPGESIEV
jgi:Cft2 family RNA processing exonuclease